LFNSIAFVDVCQVNLDGLKLRITKDEQSKMETQEIKDILGRNIKYFRFHRHLSESALAEKANISVTFLSNIERGKMFPKAEALSRLTESLNVSVFELFRTDLVHDDNKETINRFSVDITKNVNLALEEVIKQYMG
jgi:transcriptional regulator with XRE-family HTH domain